MLKAAIYGMGRWGARLVDSVKASDKIRIVKGISRNPARHGEFTAKTGIPVVSSYADVLKDPQIGAVVLATPHSLHHEHIAAAARAGKHVFCEKPIALTRANAESAVAACRAAGVTLGLGFNRRYAPAFLEMMRRINAGYLATVFVTGELWRVHAFGTKGWLEMRGDTELVACALEGKPERITLPAVDRAQATLEAFADAVAAKKPFMVPPEQAVNGIAVLEAIVASAASGKPVAIG